MDALASTTQFDESLGKKRRKLYELQAIIHHLKGEKLEAVNAISYAMTLNGGVYPEASSLLDDFIRAEGTSSTIDNVSPTTPAHVTPSQTSDQNTPGALPLIQPPSVQVNSGNNARSESPQSHTLKTGKDYQGIQGWLLVFLALLALSIFLQVGGLSEISDLWQLAATGAALTSLSWIPVFIIFAKIFNLILYFWLFFSILQRKKSTIKDVYIVMIIGVGISLMIYLGLVSYWNSLGFPPLSVSQHLNLLKPLAQSVISAAVWITYFSVSKRVKATLIE